MDKEICKGSDKLRKRNQAAKKKWYRGPTGVAYRNKPEVKKRDAAIRRAYMQRNKERFLARARELAKEKRLKVITHYTNGLMCCACCREQTYEFLSIDHVNGGGGKHRKSIKRGSFCHWLIKNNFPADYQILCHNCNQAKGYYGICPHNQKREEEIAE